MTGTPNSNANGAAAPGEGSVPNGDGAAAAANNTPGAQPGDNSGNHLAAPQNTQPDWSAFVAKLDDLNTNLSTTLGGKLDTLNTTVTQAATEPEAAPDFDAMTPAELHSYTLAQTAKIVKDALAAALEPLHTQVRDVNTRVITNDARTEIATLAAANKDFNDWRPDMIALAKENPVYQALSVRDLFDLVRSRNPAKAGELDRKYNPPAQKPRPPFSLPPGVSGKGGATVQTSAEAGRSAYLEVMERHPGVLAALQE